MKAAPPWTPEEVTILREGWLAGKSAKQIGVELGRAKGAITGKADRLGLPRRQSPIICGGGNVTSKIKRPTGPTLAPLRSTPMASKPIIAEPPRIPGAKACAWPLNSGRLSDGQRGWLFCDAAHRTGGPYCEQHAKIAYTAKPAKEMAA